MNYMNMGDIVGRESQTAAPYQFTANNSLVSIGFGRRMAVGLLSGVSIKYVREQIADVTAGGCAADIGLLYTPASSRLALGLAVRNIGGKIRFIDKSEDLPLSVTLGAGYRIGGLLVGCDIRQYVYDQATELAVGTEFAPLRFISLRGGFLLGLANSTAHDTGSGGSESFDVSAGFGLKIGKSHLDYAFAPLRELGATHKLSLTIRFK
jgi:hypothetical protein